jgi:[glutamine synthetase] adenylyltransferase / [glutamine synthetase]-adenylyl-L-tyrosine phosphorylase
MARIISDLCHSRTLGEVLMSSAKTLSACTHAAAYSRFAQRVLTRTIWARLPLPDDAFSGALTVTWLRNRYTEWLALSSEHDTLAKVGQSLRRLRDEVMLLVMDGDLAGRLDLDNVTSTMSALAEVAVHIAQEAVTAELSATFGHPMTNDGQVQSLLIVGMGKLGGRELNVSSDIDLIFLYEEDGDTQGGRRSLSNHEYFTRLGKKLIGLLSDVTADGYVFRVDMRLRPNGDSGPLVCSLGMLETYLLVQGREWERYAWIKGRVINAHDLPGAKRGYQQLKSLIQPFVFRRYLDYGVIGAIRDLHAQIGAEARRRSVRGRDIKLGRGGIREIEFIAQVFQLIRGGQDGALRIRPTRHVLAVAAERGLLNVQTVQALDTSYIWLRQLEHRLQYLDDAQTHSLPTQEADLLAVAHAMGLRDGEALVAKLDEIRAIVEPAFDETFVLQQETSDDSLAVNLWSDALADESQTQILYAQLHAQGFEAPPQVLTRLQAAWHSPRFKSLPENSRIKVDKLVHQALRQVKTLKNPDTAFIRLIDLFEAVSRRSSYLSLLSEFPRALARVAEILSATRWGADYLIHHPQLLDELLDERILETELDPKIYWPAFQAGLERKLAATGDNVEQAMDLLRQAHHAEVFGILLRDLHGQLSVETVSDRLSELADVFMNVTVAQVWKRLPARYRHREHPAFAVIAYGKWGGKELGYGSDLDVIFLYDDNDQSAPENYAALGRRLITWLTTYTAAGTLFEVDTRLRPNGESGLLVTHLESFRRYQLRSGDNSAWVWEHQALSRARFAAGDPALADAFETIRETVLQQNREPKALADEIISMRQRMAEGHLNKTALFDVKHDAGGMVDVEFAVQYLILAHAGTHPSLCKNIGNIALLHEASDLGLIDPKIAEASASSYRALRAAQHHCRLDGLDKARVPGEGWEPTRQAVKDLWSSIFN